MHSAAQQCCRLGCRRPGGVGSVSSCRSGCVTSCREVDCPWHVPHAPELCYRNTRTDGSNVQDRLNPGSKVARLQGEIEIRCCNSAGNSSRGSAGCIVLHGYACDVMDIVSAQPMAAHTDECSAVPLFGTDEVQTQSNRYKLDSSRLCKRHC